MSSQICELCDQVRSNCFSLDGFFESRLWKIPSRVKNVHPYCAKHVRKNRKRVVCARDSTVPTVATDLSKDLNAWNAAETTDVDWKRFFSRESFYWILQNHFFQRKRIFMPCQIFYLVCPNKDGWTSSDRVWYYQLHVLHVEWKYEPHDSTREAKKEK